MMVDDTETPLKELIEGLDPIVRSETRRILGEWLAVGAGLPPHECDELYDLEALRLQHLADVAAQELREASETQWRQAYPGQPASYADKLAWFETAKRHAREMVLSNELYPRVTPEVAETRERRRRELALKVEARREQARLARDPERWKTKNVAWMPVAERIAHRLWLDKPGWFLSLGQALITQRLEDGLPVPATNLDPLCEQLEIMIDAEIAANPPADMDLPF